MNIEEIKTAITGLLADITEDNAPAIAARLYLISRCVTEQCANPVLVRAQQGFVEKLNNNIEEIKTESSRIQRMLADQAGLLEKKQEWELKYQEWKVRETNLKALQSLQNEIVAADLSSMEASILSLKANSIPMLENFIQSLLRINAALDAAELNNDKSLSPYITRALQNLTALKKSQFDALQLLSAAGLLATASTLDTEYKTMIDEYDAAVKKILGEKHALDEIEQKQLEFMTAYRQHLRENQTIYNALKTRTTVGNELLDYAQSLSEEVRERLELFDVHLRTLVNQRDRLPIYKLAQTLRPSF
jgi:hypothetical protein